MKDKPHGKAAAANDYSAAPSARIKDLDPALIELLGQYKDRHGLSNDQLGKRLGYNATYCVRAFGGNFTGDADAFQAAARKLLDDEFQSRHKVEALSEHGFMVEPVREFLDSVRVSKSIGVTWGPPGKGKSKALEVYRRHDPLCIMVTACKSMSGWRGLRDAVLAAVPNKRRLKGESWDEWLVRNFRGTGRLLIVDNAHLLTASARHWIAYDWHDYSRIDCPAALVGNEEIIASWSRNDQHKSRVGVAYEVKSKQRATDTARELVRLYLPGSEGDTEAVGLATAILKSGGACRAVEKHLLIAADLVKAGHCRAAEAIKAANGLLLTDVRLAA